MKNRSDKRISASFSRADLQRLLECIDPKSCASIPERAACYKQINRLYNKLDERLRDQSVCEAPSTLDAARCGS